MTNINATVTQLPDINVTLDIVGSTTLGGINDVELSILQNNDFLIYNSGTEKWENTQSSATISWGDITGTLSSQIDLNTALGLKADDSDLTSHTGTSTIHFTQAAISIPASQISDFDIEVSNNSSVVSNTSKVTNVSTNLSEGTNTLTTVDIDSSDGTNATLVSASVTRAGLLTKAKYDEIVANTLKISYTDSSDVSSNTTHRGLTNNPHTVTATQVGLGNVDDVGTDDTAYNATTWNTNSDAATKNAIRDKIETMDTAIGLNTSKVTNATHTGDVTGSGALAINKTAITGKTLVTAVSGDQVLITDGSDTDNLKRVNVSDFLGGGGSGDVTGPGVAVDENITLFDSTTGKLIKDSGVNISAVTANTSKVTNATHTGEVTGSGALTVDKTAITGQTVVTAVGADFVLISDTGDTGNLKKALISDFASAGGDMAASVYDPATIAEQLIGLTATQTLTNKTITLPTLTLKQSATPTPTSEGDIQWDTDGNQIVIGDGAGQKTFSDDTVVEARANHTGTQTASTISDFESTVSANSSVSANTAKDTNVSTDLSAGTRTATTIGVNSSDGTNATLVEADTTNAGILGSDKWDEIVANTLKDTNVSTDLSEGTSTTTTVDVNSSDGTNATLVSASTTRAGLLTKAKWDEIVANTSKVTNATHTGDVTGATTLTIGTDKVKDTMIDFGTGAGQVSTADVPEQTNLYYTESRVDANSSVAANTSKVTNANHTGDVTGDTSLTLDKTAVTGQSTVTAVGADFVLISDTGDTGNLKKALISDFASAGGDMAAAVYDPTTIAADVFDMDNMIEGTTTKILTDTERSAISTNTSKDTNVSTNLSEGTTTNTTVDVNSSDGTNATLVAASTSRAGVLTKAKFDEIVVNTAKTGVTTEISNVVEDTTPQLGGDLDWNSNGMKLVSQTVGGSNADAVYLSGSLTWSQADASAEATVDTLIAIRISATEVLTHGVYTTSGLTAGSIYYISETSGAITTTKPTTTGTIVRSIGYALSTTELFVDPDKTYIENA